jgi:hypothetical protein
MAITVLAVLGVFDPVETQVRGSSTHLDVLIHYPTRSRFKQEHTVAVHVRNTSREALADVQVVFAKSYLDAFGNLRFVPGASLLAQEAYAVPLGTLEEGGMREVTVELEAQRRGWHEGAISVRAAGTDELRVALRGVVLP